MAGGVDLLQLHGIAALAALTAVPSDSEDFRACVGAFLSQQP
jgi:hypothetical protein